MSIGDEDQSLRKQIHTEITPGALHDNRVLLGGQILYLQFTLNCVRGSSNQPLVIWRFLWTSYDRFPPFQAPRLYAQLRNPRQRGSRDKTLGSPMSIKSASARVTATVDATKLGEIRIWYF